MSLLWWILIAIGGFILIFQMLGTGKLKSAMELARRTGEIAGIIAVVEGMPEKKHPNMWDQTIGTLWQEYHREAALALMMAAAVRSDAPIVQFWLKKALEVEPEMARETFSAQFLEEYFRPDVAARCGRTCCG